MGCLHGIVVFYCVFCVLQVVLSLGGGDGFDIWEIIDDCANETKQHPEWISIDCRQPQLKEAAGWPVKTLKMISYGSEVICGLFLIFSHLVIWWFCEERHYDLPEELLHLDHNQQILSDELQQALPASFSAHQHEREERVAES